MAHRMNFTISRTPTWSWLLSLFGATGARSRVRLDDDALDVEFGPFHERIALRDVARVGVAHRQLPWWQYSIGWRANLRGSVALLGEAANVVQLSLARPFRVRLFPGVRVTCRELFISLEAPDAFVRAVGTKLARA
jgi:hypothetical protein